MYHQDYVRDLSDVTYILASLFFILSLAGLSKHETATKGNIYGMIGMLLSILVTIFDPGFGNPLFFLIALIPGLCLGAGLALQVEMTAMPQLVALLHSFVGVAAVLVGIANAVSTANAIDISDLSVDSPLIHKVEIFIGVFIGAVTVTGSLVAAGKLNEYISSSPLILPGRHIFNIILVSLSGILMILFCSRDEPSYILGIYHWELYLMLILAFGLGWHLVMSIGGADMPVVVSMLNSYSGWATAASGFMLQSNLLIITGSLVGSSGAILRLNQIEPEDQLIHQVEV